MKTYIFKAVIEKDEDRWVAYVPKLKDKGGATWGKQKRGFKKLRKVVSLF